MNAEETPGTPLELRCAELLLAETQQLLRSWREDAGAELPPGSPDPATLSDLLPDLLADVADWLRSEANGVAPAWVPRTGVLERFGRERLRERVHPRELIGEFERLARVLDDAVLRWLNGYARSSTPASVVRVAGRVNRAPILFAASAIGAYHDEQVRFQGEEAERIRAFADNLAHELKTPLAAAETAALALEDDGLVATSQDRRRLAGLIQRNLHRARTLVDDLRALALAESPESGPHRLPMGIVLASVLAEAREATSTVGVALEVLEPVPDLEVDAIAVRLALLNLIDNGVKYADPQQPQPRVRIAFEWDAAVGVWWVAVSDNGLGIAEEHRPHVFDRFYRGHAERADGSGLGLAIVREAVERMGSTIRLDTAPGAGSTFRFWVRPTGTATPG
jgi:signal transduction histidine kinase